MRRNSTTTAQNLSEEAQRIQAALPNQAQIVVLDEQGLNLTSIQLSQRLDRWMQLGRDICLIIGSADGLDPSIKQIAHETLQLSNLTLPHGLVRIILAEQIYRAWSILHNHPYHRA